MRIKSLKSRWKRDGLNKKALQYKECNMNGFFKKSLISTAFVFLSAGAMAADPIIYTWSGPIEPLEPLMGFCVVVSEVLGEQLAHNAGVLTFKASDADNTKVDIESSSELAFTVVSRDPETQYCDGEEIPFVYTLDKFDVKVFGGNGLIEKSVDDLASWKLKYRYEYYNSSSGSGGSGYGYLTAVINKPQTMEYGGHIGLTVEGKELDIQEGDMAQAQAFILVSNSDAF